MELFTISFYFFFFIFVKIKLAEEVKKSRFQLKII